jgi:hypothetical protein
LFSRRSNLRAPPPLSANQQNGTITGNVSNLATGNLLEGAQVEIPALGLRTLTDNTGRYTLPACRRARTRSSRPTSASTRSAAR